MKKKKIMFSAIIIVRDSYFATSVPPTRTIIVAVSRPKRGAFEKNPHPVRVITIIVVNFFPPPLVRRSLSLHYSLVKTLLESNNWHRRRNVSASLTVNSSDAIFCFLFFFFRSKSLIIADA